MELQHGFGISVPQLEGICSGVCSSMCLLCGGSHLHARKSKILSRGREHWALYGAIYGSFILTIKHDVMCCYWKENSNNSNSFIPLTFHSLGIIIIIQHPQNKLVPVTAYAIAIETVVPSSASFFCLLKLIRQKKHLVCYLVTAYPENFPMSKNNLIYSFISDSLQKKLPYPPLHTFLNCLCVNNSLYKLLL